MFEEISKHCFASTHQYQRNVYYYYSLSVRKKMSNETIAAAGICASYIYFNNSKVKKKTRRWWQRKFLEKGFYYGENIMAELKLEDGSGFRNFLRMTTCDFEELLQMIGPKIARIDTKYRPAISPSIRLAVTLRFLASGDSYTSLMYTFKISKQSISSIVPETCEALIQSLTNFIQVSFAIPSI